MDDSFPIGNFVIDGYSTPYRFDRNANDGRIVLYIREDIPYPIATEKDPYKPWKTMINSHLSTQEKYLDLHSSKHEEVLILAGFSVGLNEQLCSPFVKVVI